MARAMSDTELRHRKKVQAGLSQAGGALGLTALGGTMLASRGGRNTLRKIPQLKSRMKAPPPRDPKRDHIKGAITPVLATSAGLGGVGAFNFAAYTKAEARKRQPTAVKKREDEPMEMGYFGEEGHPIELPEIKVPVSKAWEPTAGNFDSESSRKKRNQAYKGAALVGAGVGGAYTGHHGMKAIHAGGKVKPIKMVTEAADGTPSKKKVLEVKALKTAGKHGGRAALGVGAVTGAAVAHKTLRRKEKGSWQPYAKRDSASAFGIDHA
jgi:hypothetical protein